MNIAASNGKVHRASGNRTACKTRIRACWQPTDDELTCVRCGAPEPPHPPPSGAPNLSAPPEPQPMTSAEMLSILNARIVTYDDILIIQVIPDMPDATVSVPRSDLRDWCERRIKSRKLHKNKAIRAGSGPPSLGVIRTM